MKQRVLVAALGLGWALTACSNGKDAPEESQEAEMTSSSACRYGDTRVEVGASVPDVDGCNTCTCNEGSNGAKYMTCTELACAPSAECKTGVRTYGAGESWPMNDGCNTCTCNEGANGGAYVTCTQLACLPMECPPVTCDLFCSDGFQQDADGCEICACR